MKAVRHSVFETNSSSTHSLSIENVYIDEKTEENLIPKCEKISLGRVFDSDFLICSGSTRFSGFKDKLYCLMAFLICYYEDKVEYCNFEKLHEQFLKSCHYLWICELLKEKYGIELSLSDFKQSGVYLEDLEDNVFEALKLPLFYPNEFKERVDEILTNPDIVLEYYCEEY